MPIHDLSFEAQAVAFLLRKGCFGVVFDAIRRRLYSNTLHYCLRRDLAISFESPAARIPLKVRALRDSDVPPLFNMDAPGITGEGVYLRLQRLRLLRTGIPTCYVAVTPDDSPCYMQWLIAPSENEKLQAYSDFFPLLGPDEALLESAFTLEAYRKQGVRSCAMAQIAERAQAFGAGWAIVFVARDNIASLKGAQHAGFVPYALHHERWRLWRRRVTSTPCPAGTPAGVLGVGTMASVAGGTSHD